jgi:hypothetical protein
MFQKIVIARKQHPMVLNLVLLGQKKTIGCCGLNITINNMYHLGVIDPKFDISKIIVGIYFFHV